MSIQSNITKIVGGACLLASTLLSYSQGANRNLADLDKSLIQTRNTLASWAEKTSLGGYGELHYNAVEGSKNEIDFHRFVLFINHDYNDRIRLISELELEHSLAGEGKPGEVELEQAYIQFDLQNSWQIQAGLFLIPVGILNENHEPDTFYGVERNIVENRIIPTTWWEGGIGVNKYGKNFFFNGAFTSSLAIPTSGKNIGRIRSGRQKVAEAIGDSWALTTRFGYTNKSLRATIFTQWSHNVAQDDDSLDEGAFLYGGTIEYRKGGFQLKALYARWSIEGGYPNQARDQYGWYVEPSYQWQLSNNKRIGVFARYAEADYYRGGVNREEVTTVGVNFWPTNGVVLKADYQFSDVSGARANTADKFNLGVGFQF